MKTALPTIEGLYAAYSSLGPGGERPYNFSVIGPTREELESLAPTVLRFLDDKSPEYSSLHVPVHVGDSLRRVAEMRADWVRDKDSQTPWAHCIALPEEIILDWPKEQKLFSPAMIQCLHPQFCWRAL